MTLRTNTIVVRGQSYTVREPSGKDMVAIRKLLADEKMKVRLEGFVSFVCCETPGFKTEDAAHEEPMAVLQAISAEAFRLMNEDDGDPKAKAD